MTKLNLTAAVAAMLMAAAPLAYAQTSTERHTTAMATSPAGSEIQSDQFRASKMIGSTVYDVHNADVGKVADIVLDRNGRVAAVVVAVGGGFLGTGGKNVAVPLSDIKTDNNRLTLNQTKDQLQQAQNYKLENPETGAGSSTSPVEGGHLGSASGSNRR